MSLTSRIRAAARAVKRRVSTRSFAATAVSLVGVIVTAVGLAGWSTSLALVFVGASLLAYGLLFIDIEPRRRGDR